MTEFFILDQRKYLVNFPVDSRNIAQNYVLLIIIIYWMAAISLDFAAVDFTLRGRQATIASAVIHWPGHWWSFSSVDASHFIHENIERPPEEHQDELLSVDDA